MYMMSGGAGVSLGEFGKSKRCYPVGTRVQARFFRRHTHKEFWRTGTVVGCKGGSIYIRFDQSRSGIDQGMMPSEVRPLSGASAADEPVVLLGGSEKTHYKSALALIGQAADIQKKLEAGMPACGKDSIEALAEVARIYGGLRQEALYLKDMRKYVQYKAVLVWTRVLRPLAAHIMQNCMRG